VTWKNFWDNKEELFIGAFLQFPLYFIVGWKILPIMVITAILWRWGGVTDGWKPARWALVPITICLSAFLAHCYWTIFLATPFMVKLMPFSYGKSGWLFKWLKNDFLVRLIFFGWYWLVFSIAYCL
jgi:hypothetical protein